MLFAHITDLHVTPEGERAMAVVSTNDFLAAAVAHLNGLVPRPDFVVITGDLVNDGKKAEYATLEKLLAPLTMPVYAIPGNHDDRDHLRALFAGKGFFPADGPFLHYVVADYPVRLIFLDTVVAGEPFGTLCAQRLGWLAKRLGEAADLPTLLFMHHPPVPVGIGHMDGMRCANSSSLASLIRCHGAVQRVLCGHVHRPITVNWAGTVVTVGPSTAHHVALDFAEGAPAAWTLEPPAVTLHQWRPGTGLISHLSYVGDYPSHQFG